MKTNFFQNLNALKVRGNWNITIKPLDGIPLDGISLDGTPLEDDPQASIWVVSVLHNDNACGEKAAAIVPPAILKGTPQQLDQGFFEAISAPVQKTAELFSNMEEYLRQREQAKKASAMEKEKAEKEKQEKAEKQKKYDATIKAVDQLESAGEFRKAFTHLPNPEEYPDQAEAIRKRRTRLAAKISQPSLF